MKKEIVFLCRNIDSYIKNYLLTTIINKINIGGD